MPIPVSRRAPLATAFVLAITLVGCSSSTSVHAEVKPEGKRNSAPDFTLKDNDGRTVKLSDYKGKVVLLNFWATWCGPCKIEIPWFMDFEKQYKDHGFSVLGVAMDDEGWQVVRPFLSEHKVNYRVMVGDEITAQLYQGLDSLPTTFVLDRDGRIAATHVGLVSKSEYQNEITQLLKTATAVGGASAASGSAELARAK
ncbi:MAG: redoxin domain-containing protein [Bryobacteraceae bacterium]